MGFRWTDPIRERRAQGMWWATLEMGGGAQRGNLGSSAFFFKGLPFFLSSRNFLKWESAPLITFFRDRKEKSVTVARQKEISGFPGKSRLFCIKRSFFASIAHYIGIATRVFVSKWGEACCSNLGERRITRCGVAAGGQGR